LLIRLALMAYWTIPLFLLAVASAGAMRLRRPGVRRLATVIFFVFAVLTIGAGLLTILGPAEIAPATP
jgi:hypothetical protein